MQQTQISARISTRTKMNMDIRLAKLKAKDPSLTQERYIEEAIAEKNSRKDWAVLSS